jgi:hypothetical protein
MWQIAPFFSLGGYSSEFQEALTTRRPVAWQIPGYQAQRFSDE